MSEETIKYTLELDNVDLFLLMVALKKLRHSNNKNRVGPIDGDIRLRKMIGTISRIKYMDDKTKGKV